MHLSLSLASATIILVTFSHFQQINGHGYLESPRSRNFFASQDGVNGEKVGFPNKDYCPHCCNKNEGDNEDNMVCGLSTFADYNKWMDSTGQEKMPWISQAEYNQGDIIQIDSYLDTHHNGHCEVKACVVDGESTPTQTCFDANPLTYVGSIGYNMPADPNYPERGYYWGGQGGAIKSFSMKFRLPSNVAGNRVLLQW